MGLVKRDTLLLVLIGDTKTNTTKNYKTKKPITMEAMEAMEETAPYFLSSDALLTPIDNDQIAPTG